MGLDKNFFAQFKFEELEPVPGWRAEFPIRYFDWSMIAASFPVPIAKVQEVLPSPKLKPVRLQPDTTTVILMAMEYRRFAPGYSYNEFAIGIPVLYEPLETAIKLPGTYIHHMPVTEERARWGGVVMAGFPKFLAEIQFEDRGEIHRCHVRAEGKDLITLGVKKLVPQSQTWVEYTFTVKEGQLMSTRITIQGQRGLTNARGGASYILGDHPIAEELRALEVGETSMGHEYDPKLQSVLPLPEEQFSL